MFNAINLQKHDSYKKKMAKIKKVFSFFSDLKIPLQGPQNWQESHFR